MTSAGGNGSAARPATPSGALWVERLTLTNFRSYASTTVEVGAGAVVLIGANGAGKTNLLEAVSLLAPGQGLRGADFGLLAARFGQGDWAVAARVQVAGEPHDIGTGLRPAAGPRGRNGRIVRIDGATQTGSGALAELVEMVWLTPALDGLFTGPASERRRFLDRLIVCFDPSYRSRLGQFDRAMRQRNRLLGDGVSDKVRFEGLEIMMAETGVAIAAARAEALAQLCGTIAERRARDPASPFPWAGLALDGRLEAALADQPAVEVEDLYARLLRDGRERDRGAGRTLEGPHRTDLLVTHGPKTIAAELSSTGEQKALLVGLVLAHAELSAHRRDGMVPILLLDEIAAHLDKHRRAALFEEIVRLGGQCWMTGTDTQAFAALAGRASFLRIEDGCAVAIS